MCSAVRQLDTLFYVTNFVVMLEYQNNLSLICGLWRSAQSHLSIKFTIPSQALQFCQHIYKNKV
jgi:hypothetical protein